MRQTRWPDLAFNPTLAVAAHRPSGNPPDCPHCRAALDAAARYHRAKVTDDEGEHTLLVIYRGERGWALAFCPGE